MHTGSGGVLIEYPNLRLCTSQMSQMDIVPEYSCFFTCTVSYQCNAEALNYHLTEFCGQDRLTVELNEHTHHYRLMK